VYVYEGTFVRCSTTTTYSKFYEDKKVIYFTCSCTVQYGGTFVLPYESTKVLSYNVVHVRKYESTFEDCTSGIVRTSLAYSTIINRYSTSYLRKGVRIYFRKYFRKCGDTYGSTEVHPYSGLASQFIVHVLYKKCPSRLGLGTCTRYSCSLFTFVVCIKVSIRLAHTGIWSVITRVRASKVVRVDATGDKTDNFLSRPSLLPLPA
jgi:hypothetical protein